MRDDLIPEAHVPALEVRELREVLRQRAFFIRLRTDLKNRIPALVDRHPEYDEELCLLEKLNELVKADGRWILHCDGLMRWFCDTVYKMGKVRYKHSPARKRAVEQTKACYGLE